MSDLILSAYNFYDFGFSSPSSAHGLISPGVPPVYPDRGAVNLGPGREGAGFNSPFAVPLCKTENHLVCARGYNDYLLQVGGLIYFAPLRNSYTAHSEFPEPSSTLGVWGGLQFPESSGPITDDFIDGAVAANYSPVAMWLDGDRALVALVNGGQVYLALIEPGQAPKLAVSAVNPIPGLLTPLPSGIGIDVDGNIRVAITNGASGVSDGIQINATYCRVSDPIRLSMLSSESDLSITFTDAQVLLYSSWRATGTVAALAHSYSGNFIKAVAQGPWASDGEGSMRGAGALQVLGMPISDSMLRVHMLRPLSPPSNERPAIFGAETGSQPPLLEVCSVDIAFSGSGLITPPSDEEFSPAIWTPSADMQAQWPLNAEVHWVGIDTPTEGEVTQPFWTQFKRAIEVP